MAYLKEGDTLDAHQMHTFSMNADSTKGSASTTSTSSGITNKPATKPGLKKPPPPKNLAGFKYKVFLFYRVYKIKIDLNI